ncbi:uncharacterized protein L969DRAFT_93152 [Mixia osmundae IAM 14324]|uniref:Eukaryotic translation initiation factor 3 subunit L n=1 Tax=Mixia osmundae (strain CBS 9802 / IAM 14324 / JCM 22182 / KY 12970) TaxID=764103 RepID=G7E5Y1_MIXOS|nr:uncharacterized protein L969DRAFT_93152 [Mixia osmundae IAM 14324]KEI40608.1 hypothetical protein L969DRAFT_93152 [Mixia osmundae IAM 14324]GAA98241.1 hypothetical protein E5Q_04924 [Mixia osmundae IAM 14324]
MSLASRSYTPEPEYDSGDEDAPVQIDGSGIPGVDDEEEEELDPEVARQRAEEAAQLAKENAEALEHVPEPVKKFITRLHGAISNGNIQEMTTAYERTFNYLSNEYYQKEEWPTGAVISSLVKDDQVFITLYKELYFRHLYSRFSSEVDIDDRFDSYENYCNLFNYILNSDGPVSIELPVQWLADIIDEFIWQFGSFAAWRNTKINEKTDDEVALLAESPQVWSCYSVLNVLYSLIQKSKIQEQLRAQKNNQLEDLESIAGDFGVRPIYRYLGIFSILGLLRVHVLLGDYTLALRMLDDIDIKHIVSPNVGERLHNVNSAHVATFYYIGFAYMMLRRYHDAIENFSRGALHFFRTRRFTHQADQVSKMVDRMIGLIAVCTSLAPVKLEERIRSDVHDKYGEQSARMLRGGSESLEVFEELWLRGSPKYLSPVAPPYEDMSRMPDYVNSIAATDPTQHHLSLFLADVKALLVVPDLRSFLKLYTSLGTAKLANLTGKTEDEVLSELAVTKGAFKTLKWHDGIGEGGLLDGEEEVAGDIGFGIDDSVVTIVESKKARAYADYFLRRGQKAKESLEYIRSRPLPPPAKPEPTSAQQTQPSATTAASVAAAAPVKQMRWGATVKAA